MQSKNDQVDQLIAEYMRRVDAGETVDEADFIAEHLKYATELKEFFCNVNLVRTKSRDTTKSKSRVLTIRCPDCGCANDLNADTHVVDLTCDSCRSEFSIAGDGARTASAPTLATIGHFQLLERVGVGGFGTVWKAYDSLLERMVAVKIPRVGTPDSNDSIRFLREARTAAQLKHPNIVSVHEVGRHEESIYIVSDFVRGMTLDDWLMAHALSIEDAAALGIKIARALQHAHEQRIIHRDLKPSNILMDEKGEPHVADFGLARHELGDITLTVDGNIIGTPAYMSPEQADGKGHLADRRSDVYSLGVVLFRLIAGELPFRGNFRMVMHQVIHDDPTSPRKFNDRVSRDLETICLKCLEKDPNRRYQAAGDVADELTRFVERRPIQARPISRAVRLLRWSNRHRATAASAVSILTILMLSSLVSSYFAVNANFERRNAERNLALAQRGVYNATLRQASQFMNDGQAGLALTLLDDESRCLPEYKDSVWRILHAHLSQFEKSWHGHTSIVRQVAVSSDGNWIVSASEDGTARIWNRETGALVRTVSNQSESTQLGVDKIYSVAFSPQDEVIATGSEKCVCLWNCDSGEELDRLFVDPEESAVKGLEFSPDGQLLVAVSHLSLYVWGLDKNYRAQLVNTLHPGGRLQDVDWSCDGKFLAVASSDHQVYVYETASWLPQPPFTGPKSWVSNVDIAPDTETLAGAAWDNTIHLWSLSDRSRSQRLEGHDGWVRAVAFSPDGRLLASGGADKTIRLWDARTGAPLGSVAGHDGIVYSVVFAPNGESILSGSADGTIKSWPLSAFLERTFELDSVPTDILASPDTKHIVFALENGELAVVDGEQTCVVSRLAGDAGKCRSMSCSGGGMMLLTCGDDSGKVARLWDVASVVEVTSLGLDDKRFDYEPQFCSAISHDGKLIALGGDNTVSIVDAQSGKILHRSDAHDNQVLAIAFSSDDQNLATGCRDASIGLWDVPSRTMIGLLLGHVEDVVHVKFSPDGRHLLSTSKDDTVRLWDLSTNTNIKTFRGHRGDVRKAMWSPDEQTIVSLDSAGMMIFWDPQLEQERARIAFPDRRIGSFAVATSPPSLIVSFAGSNHWSMWPEDKEEKPGRITAPGRLP